MTPCDANRRRIDDLVRGELAPEEWSALRAHAEGCASCRARYDRALLAERAMTNGPEGVSRPSPLELDRIGLAVLDEIAPKKSAVRRFIEKLAPSPRWAATWAVGAAAAGFLLFALPLSTRSPGAGSSATDSPEFQARGTPATERRADIRAFCVAGDGSAREDRRCRLSEQLRFTVSNTGHRYLFLVGLDQANELKWYAPVPPERRSIALTDGVDVPVGSAVRIGVNHTSGKLRVVGFFSDEPLETADIERAFAARGQAFPPPLPKSVHGRALELEITP